MPNLLNTFSQEHESLFRGIAQAEQKAYFYKDKMETMNCYICESENWLGHLMATEQLLDELKAFRFSLSPENLEHLYYVVFNELYMLISHEDAQTNIKNSKNESQLRYWTRRYDRSKGYRIQCEWFYDRLMHIDKHAADKQREVQQLITEMEQEIVDTKAQLTELTNLIGGLDNG